MQPIPVRFSKPDRYPNKNGYFIFCELPKRTTKLQRATTNQQLTGNKSIVSYYFLVYAE